MTAVHDEASLAAILGLGSGSHGVERIYSGAAVLAIFEQYFRDILATQGDADIQDLIGRIGRDFGFRGGFLIEYPTADGSGWRVIDTDPGHRDWWRDYFTSDLAADSARLAKLIQGPPIVVFDPARFGPQQDRARNMAARGDVLESTLVPVGFAGKTVGALGFRGTATLDDQQQHAVQIVAYNLFAQFRVIHNRPQPVDAVSLTRREREVIQLSAEGMTSQQIADRLGMSARTANQHFDNVADKLGTRTRAHTVAEVIRRRLVD